MRDETRTGESGFTLIELLIAMMVSGLLLAAASTGFITTAKGMADLHDRFVQSHDAQLLAAYFPSDVQSADPNLGVDTDPGAWAVCADSPPADDNVLQLQWAETTGDVATSFAVSYRIREVPQPSPEPSDWQLVRYFCSGTTVNSDVVAHKLAEPVGATSPKVDPIPFTGRKLTLTLFSAPGSVGDYSYTFSGQMRTPRPPPPHPVVSFINRKAPSPTNATTLAWKVVFDRPVTGVGPDDFSMVVTDLSGVVTPPAVVAVSDTEYTVTIDPGPGSGAIGLSLVDDNSIRDTTAAQNELGGSALDDGNKDGQSYIVDRLAPVVSSIDLAGDQSTSGPNVSWKVTFSEDVRFVDAADFILAPGPGVSGGSITLTPVSAAVYTVTAGPVGGTGTLGLDLTDDNTIRDGAPGTDGNPLGGPAAGDGDFTGPTYDISSSAPAAPSITGVELVNKDGGTPGRIETGDSVVVTFSAIMKVRSFCSPAWTGDSNDQSLATGNDVTVTITNPAVGTDVLTVTSASCGFNFGSIDLAGDYVGSTATFAGSGSGGGNPPSEIRWDATAHKLTITLGKSSSGGGTFNTVASSQPVFACSTSVTDPYDQPVDNPTYTLPNGAQF